jgi:hypothetical protein
MEFSSIGNDRLKTESVSPETSDDVRGDYKLIVVSLSDGFEEEPNKIDTIIQKSFKKWLDDLSKNKQYRNSPFTLLVIGSGRGIKEILTSEELTQLSKNKIHQQVENIMTFAAQDLRPMDDLELVDELIEDYKTLQNKRVGRILYITNDDGFERGIPRNQCMPLAWHRDKIQLHVLTRQSCDIWKKHAQLNKTNQCRELTEGKDREKDIDALVNIFNKFLTD